jgi:hypothetical protein
MISFKRLRRFETTYFCFREVVKNVIPFREIKKILKFGIFFVFGVRND